MVARSGAGAPAGPPITKLCSAAQCSDDASPTRRSDPADVVVQAVDGQLLARAQVDR